MGRSSAIVPSAARCDEFLSLCLRLAVCARTGASCIATSSVSRSFLYPLHPRSIVHISGLETREAPCWLLGRQDSSAPGKASQSGKPCLFSVISFPVAVDVNEANLAVRSAGGIGITLNSSARNPRIC